jgi:protein-tyrosine phosphatase
MPQTVLFVCTGNVCRSLAAERLLAANANCSLLPFSRGIAVNSFCPIPRFVHEFLEARGAGAAGHRPAQVTEEDVNRADLILVMEELHYDMLTDKFPQCRSKTHLLDEYTGTGRGGIIDPMGVAPKAAAKILLAVQTAVSALAAGRRSV